MTRIRFRNRAAMLLLLAQGFVACSAVTAGNPAPPTLDDTAWTLAALGGATLPAGPVPTLRFEGGRVQGSDGCNRYGAPYAAADGRLQVGPAMAATRMACPPAAMQLSAAFSAALTRAQSYRIEGQTLVLLGADGATLATFAAQATALAGTAWQLGAYDNGKQAVVSVQAGTALTLEFLAEGRLRGSAGCNGYTGSYAVTGSRLVIGTVAATRKVCAQPEGVMAQEAAFLHALETVASARREGGRLELRTAAGALAASMTVRAGTHNPPP